MCECLKSGTRVSIHYIVISNKIRHRALNFVTYKGPDYVAAAATMMGITKEAKMMCVLLRKDPKDEYGYALTSFSFRNRALAIMFALCDECFAAEESTRGSAAGKLISDESDDKHCSEKKLVKQDKLEEWNEINGKAKEELTRENNLDERNEAKQKPEIASEMTVGKEDYSGGGNETNQKEEQVKGDCPKERSGNQ